MLITQVPNLAQLPEPSGFDVFYEVNDNSPCRVVKIAFGDNWAFNKGFVYDFKQRSLESIDLTDTSTIGYLADKASKKGLSTLLIVNFYFVGDSNKEAAFNAILKRIHLEQIEMQSLSHAPRSSSG